MNQKTSSQIAKSISAEIQAQTKAIFPQKELLIGNWLYAESAEQFISDATDGQKIAEILALEYFTTFGGRVPSSEEVASWKHSLPALAKILELAGLQKQLVILEYCLPSQDLEYPKRIDAMICGYDKNNSMHAVIIELKQWGDCHISADWLKPGHLRISRHGKSWSVRHPCQQIATYLAHMRAVVEACALDTNFITFDGFAFLHNCLPSEPMKSALYGGEFRDITSSIKMYTADFAKVLGDRLKERTIGGQAEKALGVMRNLQHSALHNLERLPKRIERPRFNPFDGIVISDHQGRGIWGWIKLGLWILGRILLIPFIVIWWVLDL